MQPFQQRVVDEKKELDEKRAKLYEFRATEIFRGLPEGEKQRLIRQFNLMGEYSTVLGERIEGLCMNDTEIEKEIVEKGLIAPRITPQMISDTIAAEYVFTADKATRDCPQMPSLALLTICVLVLKNGFTVTGESACASPENFNADLGAKIARQKAIEKIWPLEGYLLREKLFGG